MPNILGFVGVGVSVVALVCACVTISSKQWETTTRTESGVTVTLNIGLWDYCLESSGVKICGKIDDQESITDDTMENVNICRSMIFIGIFGTTAAIVAGVLVMFVLESTKILYFVASGLDIFAGVCFMIAMAVYVSEVKTDGADLKAGFALVVVAWIVAWAAGGIFVGAKIIDKEK